MMPATVFDMDFIEFDEAVFTDFMDLLARSDALKLLHDVMIIQAVRVRLTRVILVDREEASWE